MFINFIQSTKFALDLDCIQSLDRTSGLVDWTGGLGWAGGLDEWTGLVDWIGGLDWWTGLVDWTTGLSFFVFHFSIYLGNWL